MATKLDEKEMVSYKELLTAQMIQIDAISQLLIEKGIITEDEFYEKLKQVQKEYQKMEENGVKPPMTNDFEIMRNPQEHGYVQCPHCNGYGSSLQDPDGVDTCTMCGGLGLIQKQQIIPDQNDNQENHIGRTDRR